MDLTTGRWVQSEPVGGEHVVAGNGWILVGNGRDADLYRGGSVQASIDVDLSRAWLDPAGDTLWVGDEELGQGRAGTVAELRPDGTATGRTIELPAMPSAIDHTGAFVVNTAAGSQLVGLDGATELSEDPVVALGPTAVISVGCDNGACGYSVIDRTDGQQRRLDLDQDFDVAPVDLGAFLWGEVSPDGRWAIMTITYNETNESGERSTWAQPAAIELETGRTVVLASESSPHVAHPHWTADSRFAFLPLDPTQESASPGDVAVFDTDTEQLVPLANTAPTSGNIIELNVRPIGWADSEAPAPVVTTDDVDEDPSLPPPESSTVETGTVPAMVAVEEFMVDDRLAGLPFEIAAVRSDGTLVRLNFVTGERRFAFASVALDGVVAHRGGVLQLGGADSVFHSDSGGVHRAQLSDETSVFHAPGSGIVWAFDDALLAGLPGEMTMLDTTGNLTHRTVEVPGPPIAVDRADNWVVTVAGNTYTVTADGATDLLTSGSLVALGETVAIAKECDEADVCGYVRIDRDTGERGPSLVPSSVALRLATRGESISPDGRFAITMASYREPTRNGDAVFDAATLVDLDQGTAERLTLALDNPVLDVYWTPDSSFAFFETYGVIVAFDTASQEIIDVTQRPTPLPGENRFVGFDVRSADLVF
ncbi:MAG: hypothetical protein R8G01_22310 [Ilumatobacteraceae bacterium]|nr:hypothetical protein [Ilumatobacteraceae bacterium]